MCLAVLALNTRPDLPLLIVANRDEYHARPSAPVRPWEDPPGIYAGRDLAAGGTWLGITRQGRYGLITNYRDPAHVVPDAPSRGALVLDYLAGGDAPLDHARVVLESGGRYNGFNLIVGDASTCALAANRSGEPARLLDSGLYGLSNRLLDTAWPKLLRLRQEVGHMLRQGGQPDAGGLLDLLADRTPAPDDALPDTGVGLERERLLSPIFIAGEHYGTRCSTVIAVHADGRIRMSERRFGPGGAVEGESRWEFLRER
ncbi:NRDE family protein [Paracandidimonas soli]|uniref:NRDE family protein n=1 Tax=Paracandidimonas soli TaxID=1917182 RepID=UPI000A7EAB8F